jgi:hypothetical protein
MRPRRAAGNRFQLPSTSSDHERAAEAGADRGLHHRTTCFGFVLDGWCYLIECTAARRHYAGALAGEFDAIVRSVRLLEAARV